MEVVKLFINNKPQGIYGITNKDEVTDALLDSMNDGTTDMEYTREMLNMHLDKGLCIIPKSSKSFDWDENIHGKFFTDKNNG